MRAVTLDAFDAAPAVLVVGATGGVGSSPSSSPPAPA